MVIDVIQQRAGLVKNSETTPEVISWRYNLDLYQVNNWLSQTSWNTQRKEMTETIEKVVGYLTKLNLVSSEETKEWSKKLFI